MEHYRSVILLLLLCLIGVVLKCVQGDQKSSEENAEDDNIFLPTSEWKPIRKDQAIPRGLHVRVNLATGHREAKLLDSNNNDDDDSSNKLSILPEDNIENVDENSQVDMNELKRVMQKMMEEGIGEAVSPSQEEINKVKSKFRSYAELKKELRKMEADVKTDSEILQDTLTEYKELIEDTDKDETKKKEEEEQILSYFEYLVHQIDNAQDFMIKMNGYKTVVLPSLNSTHNTIRNEALRILGSSAQNNPIVQRFLLDEGAVSCVLRSLASDPSSSVKTSSLYALSCLIRGFPAAQRVFLDKGGLSILIKQFQSDASEHLKRQLKAVTLIRDLLEESKSAEELLKTCEDETSCRIAKIKTLDFAYMSLNSRLENEKWCEALLKLLMRHPQDKEVVDEISREMILLAKSCSKVYREFASGASDTPTWFRNLDAVNNLRQIQSKIEQLNEEISTRNYKDEL